MNQQWRWTVDVRHFGKTAPDVYALHQSLLGCQGMPGTSVLGCAHVTSVIYLGDSFKGKGSYLSWLESRRTNVFLFVCGARPCVQSSRRDCPTHEAVLSHLVCEWRDQCFSALSPGNSLKATSQVTGLPNIGAS